MHSPLTSPFYALSVVVALLLAPVSLWASGKIGPGFDCTRATTPTEKAICASSELSMLDREMSGLYRTLSAVGYPQVATQQRAWLKKRNRCGAAGEPGTCLLDAYRQRLLELAQLHVEANRYGEPYCGGECLYQWGYAVEVLRLGDEAVEYLVLNGRYIYGVVTTEYYIGTFERQRFGPKEPICSKRVDDDGRGAVTGDSDCSADRARAYFSSGKTDE